MELSVVDYNNLMQFRISLHRFKHWCTLANKLHPLLYWFDMVRGTRDIAGMCDHMDFQQQITNFKRWSVGNILPLYTYTMVLTATREQNAFSSWKIHKKHHSHGRAISMPVAKLLSTLHNSLRAPIVLESMPQQNGCIVTFEEDYSQ